MTRNDLVDAVFDKQRSLANCLTNCSGIDCEQCSENLVKKYEEEIRIDTIRNFIKWLDENYEVEIVKPKVFYKGGSQHRIEINPYDLTETYLRKGE